MSADILYVAPTVYSFIYFIYNQIVQNKKKDYIVARQLTVQLNSSLDRQIYNVLSRLSVGQT